MLEGLQYVVLTPVNGAPTRWLDWYLVFGLFSVGAGFLVLNRRVQARAQEYEHNKLMLELLRDYRKWLLADMIGAFVFGTFSLIVFGVSLLWPYLSSTEGLTFHLLVSVGFVCIGGMITYNASNQYRSLARLN